MLKSVFDRSNSHFRFFLEFCLFNIFLICILTLKSFKLFIYWRLILRIFDIYLLIWNNNLFFIIFLSLIPIIFPSISGYSRSSPNLQNIPLIIINKFIVLFPQPIQNLIYLLLTCRQILDQNHLVHLIITITLNFPMWMWHIFMDISPRLCSFAIFLSLVRYQGSTALQEFRPQYKPLILVIRNSCTSNCEFSKQFSMNFHTNYSSSGEPTVRCTNGTSYSLLTSNA